MGGGVGVPGDDLHIRDRTLVARTLRRITDALDRSDPDETAEWEARFRGPETTGLRTLRVHGFPVVTGGDCRNAPFRSQAR